MLILMLSKAETEAVYGGCKCICKSAGGEHRSQDTFENVILGRGCSWGHAKLWYQNAPEGYSICPYCNIPTHYTTALDTSVGEASSLLECMQVCTSMRMTIKSCL